MTEPKEESTETSPPGASGPEEEVHEDDLVPEDDTIIGRALRWSVLAIIALVIVVGLALFVARRPPPAKPVKAIDAAPPVEVTRSAAAPAVAFTDITRQAGIDFVHHNGARGEKLLPETMGGGNAFFDYDNDGDPDLLLVDSTDWPGSPPSTPRPSMRLYRNDGAGRFTDVTREAGLAVSFYGMGAAVGDYDGDGWTDLFITAVGKNHLFRNVHGRFEEATDRAGVGGAPDQWSTSAAFLDYDNDGRLDLFVGNYVRWSKSIDYQLDYRLTGVGRAYGPPVNYEGSFPYLYHNRGDGTFTDVSKAAGLQITNPATGVPAAKTLGIAPIDVDHDGRIDLMVANDTVGNFFFHNRGDGTFAEEGTAAGIAYDRNGGATGAMGADSAYFRNDGDVGFVIGNFANEMTSLYVSQGDPTIFADESITDGVGAPSRLLLKFGVFFFDYDLDGRLDLLESNGHLEDQINQVDPSQQYRQPAQLFWNAGPDSAQTFVVAAPGTTGDLARPIVGRGASYADIDGDGDLDVLLTQTGGPPLLLRNDQRLGHHWLRLKLAGEGGDHEAIGAWVELAAGGVTQRRQVMPTKSYLSQVELPLTFGLGEATKIDTVKVTWPDGTVQTVEPATLALDRQTTIEEAKP